MAQMLDRIKIHNNEFWDSARRYYLDDFLKNIYSGGWKRGILDRWIGSSEVKKIIFRQKDFHCDPMVLELDRNGFDIRVIENGAYPEADVTVEFTHMAIVPSSNRVKSFVYSWFWGDVSVPGLWSHLRDNLYAAAIFLLK